MNDDQNLSWWNWWWKGKSKLNQGFVLNTIFKDENFILDKHQTNLKNKEEFSSSEV